MTTSRREFLQTSIATGLIASVTAFPALGRPQPKENTGSPPAKKGNLKLLILGGTGFLGPAIIEEAKAQGHELTIFNRGKREKLKGTTFEGVEHLFGNRDPNKTSDETDPKSPKGLVQIEEAIKAGKKWDAVIDTSGYVPRIVKASAELLAPAADAYVFISTVSVYAKNDKPNEDESAELGKVEDPTTEVMGDKFQNYGPLKVLCEQAAEAAMPGKVLTLRPGFIVGVRDDSDRFSYWPIHFSQDDEVLTPGNPKDPVQYVDVRDLAKFVLLGIQRNLRGAYNVTSPSMPWGDVVNGCIAASKAVKGKAGTPVWVPNKWLAENGLEPGMFPIYLPPEGEEAGFHQRSVAKAMAAGLTIRPCVETCKEFLTWWPAEMERRERVTKEMEAKGQKMPNPKVLRAGPPPATTKELLEKWKTEGFDKK